MFAITYREIILAANCQTILIDILEVIRMGSAIFMLKGFFRSIFIKGGPIKISAKRYSMIIIQESTVANLGTRDGSAAQPGFVSQRLIDIPIDIEKIFLSFSFQRDHQQHKCYYLFHGSRFR